MGPAPSSSLGTLGTSVRRMDAVRGAHVLAMSLSRQCVPLPCLQDPSRQGTAPAFPGAVRAAGIWAGGSPILPAEGRADKWWVLASKKSLGLVFVSLSEGALVGRERDFFFFSPNRFSFKRCQSQQISVLTI